MIWHQYLTSYPSRLALLDQQSGNQFTWSELAQQIEQRIQILADYGLTQGAGLALCGKNNLELLLFYLAGLQLNLRVMGINPAFHSQKIEQLCDYHHIDLVIYWKDEPANLQFEPRSYGKKKFGNIPLVPLTITLTSGSTGMPKGAIHSIDAHLANAEGVCELMQINTQSKLLLSLPLYHVSGQGIVWRWLFAGAELHLPQQDFYQSLMLVSHTSLVPTQLFRFYQYLADQGYPAFQLRHILLGGSHISPALTEKLQSLNITGYCGYGMTEMASTVFAKICDGKNGVGQLLKNREYCLENGEIWLRGRCLALGYWQQNAEQHFIQPLVNHQGWFASKDLGQWQQGEIKINGRLDNMFISGGENIQPEEIENLILQSEMVEQVFVLPKTDPEFGERPVAFIQFKEHFSQTAVEKLQCFLREKLERFKQPIAYYPLQMDLQGNIKISRAVLLQQLKQLSSH